MDRVLALLFETRLAEVFSAWQDRLTLALREAQTLGHVGRDCEPTRAARFLVASLENQSTSTQSNVLVTAFFQRSYPVVRCSSLHCGCQRFDSFQLERSSSVFFQNPTASPAAYAAPSAVVSATTGRLTGVFSRAR